jgi:hypothetical protein
MAAASGLAQAEVRVVSKAERIEQEARTLWLEVFGEPPAPGLSGRQILDLLMSRTAPPTYARLNAAARARNNSRPRKSSSR